MIISACSKEVVEPPPSTTCAALPPWPANIVAILFDDFERPNQLGLGRPISGTSWTLYGPDTITRGRIENGSYTAGPPMGPPGNLVYAATFVEKAPDLIVAHFNFVTTTNSGGTDGGIAILSTTDPPPGKLWKNMLHLSITTGTWVLSIYRNGVPHLLSNGTSAGVFSLVPDGRTYNLFMQVKGDTVQLYLPTGEIVQACDPEVSDVHGNQLIFEHIYTNQSVHYGRFDLVGAFLNP
jgi:hypothetical protein